MAEAKNKEDLVENIENQEADVVVAVENQDSAVDVAAPAAADEKEGTAKAGKRSAKSLKEAEEKAEKEARKEAGDTTAQGEHEAAETKGPRPVTRSRLERRGKSYRKVAELVEKDKAYSLAEALELAAKTNPSKFDAAVELHVALNVDPRQADQNIRTTVSLPNGTGKTIRVAVFAPSDQHAAAKEAGADIVGEDDFLQQLDKGELNFDILIATPQQMPKLGKYARTLGPRGLMPNPKSGTVATNVAKAVQEAKAGRVEYRVDKQSIVHISVGKVSFGGDKLTENAKAFFASLQAVKPSGLKGNYITAVSAATTMGPGIKVDLTSL
ncbi:50S ribosomal protein L1 [Candidatus Saccharibacteria bacterium]|nr:50S ribosomal protein L1 [Candidatus Saccharibacteria bacterium]